EAARRAPALLAQGEAGLADAQVFARGGDRGQGLVEAGGGARAVELDQEVEDLLDFFGCRGELAQWHGSGAVLDGACEGFHAGAAEAAEALGDARERAGAQGSLASPDALAGEAPVDDLARAAPGQGAGDGLLGVAVRGLGAADWLAVAAADDEQPQAPGGVAEVGGIEDLVLDAVAALLNLGDPSEEQLALARLDGAVRLVERTPVAEFGDVLE